MDCAVACALSCEGSPPTLAASCPDHWGPVLGVQLVSFNQPLLGPNSCIPWSAIFGARLCSATDGATLHLGSAGVCALSCEGSPLTLAASCPDHLGPVPGVELVSFNQPLLGPNSCIPWSADFRSTPLQCDQRGYIGDKMRSGSQVRGLATQPLPHGGSKRFIVGDTPT